MSATNAVTKIRGIPSPRAWQYPKLSLVRCAAIINYADRTKLMLPIRGVIKYRTGGLKHVLDSLYLGGSGVETYRNAEIKLAILKRACSGNCPRRLENEKSDKDYAGEQHALQKRWSPFP